jgi:hypothetical protein
MAGRFSRRDRNPWGRQPVVDVLEDRTPTVPVLSSFEAGLPPDVRAAMLYQRHYPPLHISNSNPDA